MGYHYILDTVERVLSKVSTLKNLVTVYKHSLNSLNSPLHSGGGA